MSQNPPYAKDMVAVPPSKWAVTTPHLAGSIDEHVWRSGVVVAQAARYSSPFGLSQFSSRLRINAGLK